MSYVSQSFMLCKFRAKGEKGQVLTIIGLPKCFDTVLTGRKLLWPAEKFVQTVKRVDRNWKPN